MDEGNIAVTPAEAPVTESAPVEESTVDGSMETSEKTEITQEGQQDNPEVKEGQVVDDKGQLIPKDRFDEVVRERNELRELKARIESERMEQERLASMTPDEAEREQQMKVAKDALKKVGLVDQDTVKQMVEQRLQEDKMRNWFVSEMNRLESTYNGKDGMPKFVPQDVAKYMDTMGINDPEVAYKAMNVDAIVEARAKASKGTAYSERSTGGTKEMTDSSRADLAAAAKSGRIEDYLKKYVGPSM